MCKQIRDMGGCIDIQMGEYARRFAQRASGEFNSPLQWAGDVFDVWCV
ncbi:MAG: hypothetical protein QM654_12220 [Dysgonamonadaceae bacterium]